MHFTYMTEATPARPSAPTVSNWVARWAGVIREGGTVLDLACGSGRHARHLAALGHRVEAVDRDIAALAALAGVAGIAARCADLEGGAWPYAEHTFDGIVVTNYLHRPLLPLINAMLAPGTVLIYETFSAGNESYGKPSNPAFLLRAGELLAFAQAAGLHILAFEDGFCAQPKPSMMQRLCAVKPPFLSPEQGRLE